MSELSDKLAKLFDAKDDKNYDPRMEELMRSDRLIDPKNETLSNLEDQEIFHIAKIRGAQVGFRITLKDLRAIYNLPHLADYHCDYIDYIRKAPADLDNMQIGGLPMLNVMIEELIKLRRSKEGWAAKLYADSIKPQVANMPPAYPVPQEEKPGFFGWIVGLLFGKKKEEPRQGYRP